MVKRKSKSKKSSLKLIVIVGVFISIFSILVFLLMKSSDQDEGVPGTGHHVQKKKTDPLQPDVPAPDVDVKNCFSAC